MILSIQLFWPFDLIIYLFFSYVLFYYGRKEGIFKAMKKDYLELWQLIKTIIKKKKK